MRNPATCFRIGLAALVVMFARVAGVDGADPPHVVSPSTLVPSGHYPPLGAPARVGRVATQSTTLTWTPSGLHLDVSAIAARLASLPKKGTPIFDPSSSAWYASTIGSISRIETSRIAPVFDNVQGIDIDVRAALDIAVSREPNDTIVLHHHDGTKRLLLSGWQFFNPRFSPDGSRVLVSESKTGGGQFWVVSLEGNAVSMTQGYEPVWHPDGTRILFTRTQNDGMRRTASDLWILNINSKAERLLASTPRVETRPAFSPDGKAIAFVDADASEVFVAAFDLAQGPKGR